MALPDLPQAFRPSSLPMYRACAAASPGAPANAAVRALGAPDSGDIKGQAAYLHAVSDALDALPRTPYHDATRARFRELLEGGAGDEDDSALFPPRAEDWFFVLIEEGGFSSIAFWGMTIMLRGRRGILLGGISASGFARMMTGEWIGILLGTSRRICLLAMGFLQAPVRFIGTLKSKLREIRGGCCSVDSTISSAQIVTSGLRIFWQMMVGAATAVGCVLT
jgi:hypothetical protein